MKEIALSMLYMVINIRTTPTTIHENFFFFSENFSPPIV